MKLAPGKNGTYPLWAEPLYSTLKYCGPNALSLKTPPKLELYLATPKNDKVSPDEKEDVITWDIS